MPDPARIEDRLEQLWRIALGPGGGADRPAFSEAEARAMRLVAGWAREAGLEPGLDRHGNLWALPDGTGPVVTAGSHVDSVPDGGRYDGALGTVLGLELAAELPERGGLLVCAAEEAPRFGAGTIGSRLLAGTLDPDSLRELRDAAGVSAAEARETYVHVLAQELPRLEEPLRERWRAHAEVHVAQRRALRRLGVVTKVAGPRRFELELTGEAGHAGEVPIAERHDALAAAAEVVLAVERAARAEAPQALATAGTLSVWPGAVSAVPGRARLGIDARGIEPAALDRLEAALRAEVAEVSSRRGVAAEVRLVRDSPPVALDPALADLALQVAAQLGVVAERTWSGAGHDAQHLAALVPTLLLFVPLHGGESHTPQEGAEISEILDAARVAASVLRVLDVR